METFVGFYVQKKKMKGFLLNENCVYHLLPSLPVKECVADI